MANKSIIRLKREMMDEQKFQNEAYSITFELKDDNFKTLQGVIVGPPDTPYEGGKFIVNIEIPERYPFIPPVVKFETSVWHPNINPVHGNICLDLLDHKWAASTTIRSLLISIQCLLGSPVTSDPLEADIGKQLESNPEMFNRTARYWANFEAGCSNPRDVEFDEKFEKLKQMGYDEFLSLYCLSLSNWDVEKAIPFLIDILKK